MESERVFQLNLEPLNPFNSLMFSHLKAFPIQGLIIKQVSLDYMNIRLPHGKAELGKETDDRGEVTAFRRFDARAIGSSAAQ
jgi:hypothetical protein